MNLLCIFSFCYKIWNNFLGKLFQEWEDFHSMQENLQNYGWYMTQNLMQKSTKTKILSDPHQYILSLMKFIINNHEKF